jgi:pyruvate formate lyase activating enzyme
MHPPTGIVFDIKKFSLHDGPGIRTTVFLKGCSLHCSWCHNPEGISPSAEIHYWDERCIQCHDCIEACEHGALSLEDGLRQYDPKQCAFCGCCAETCPSESIKLIGTKMHVSDVIREIEQDMIYYDQSGGGASFSGGEPLYQVDFLEALLVTCKDRGIHTTVDTSGFVPFKSIRRIMPYVDLFLFDVKIIDPEAHIQYTGVPNHRILHNLTELAKTKSRIIPRIPIIPGVNDGTENIIQTGEFLASQKAFSEVNILPYHRAAAQKYYRMGNDYILHDVLPPTEQQMSKIARELENFGFSVKIGG